MNRTCLYLALATTLAMPHAALSQSMPAVTRADARASIATGALTIAAGIATGSVGAYLAAQPGATREAMGIGAGTVAFGVAMAVLGAIVTHHGRMSLEALAPRVMVSPSLSQTGAGLGVSVRF